MSQNISFATKRLKQYHESKCVAIINLYGLLRIKNIFHKKTGVFSAPLNKIL